MARISILLTPILVLVIPTCSAQNRSSTITLDGVVRDSNAKPLNAVGVLLTASDHSATVKATSDRNGNFTLSVPHPGIYGLTITISDAPREVAEPVQLSEGRKQHIDVVVNSLGDAHIRPSVAGAQTLEFADNPNFVVAGVTDSSDAGGHGSQVRIRTSEILARDTVALKSNRTGNNAGVHSEATLDREDDASRTRQRLKELLSKDNKPEWHRLLGDVDEQLGDSLEAVHEYEQAVRIDPSEENYFSWGTELLVHGSIAPAIEVFTNGLKVHANSARMFAGLGAALYANGSPEDAAEKMCQASDLQPSDSRLYTELGKMTVSSPGALPCAEARLRRFANQTENAEANYYYGIAIWKRARDSQNAKGWREAEALLKKALTIDPKLAEAHSQLGTIYFSRGLVNEAIAAYQKAIQAEPALPEAHYRLGLAYKRIGRDAEAARELDTYNRLEQAENEQSERQRNEIRRFVIVFKDSPRVSSQ